MEKIYSRTECTNNEKGYRLIVKNLDTGKEEINATTRVIIGAYSSGNATEDGTPIAGIIITSCNLSTLFGTIRVAEQAAKKAREDAVHQALPVLLSTLFEDE